MSVFRIEKNKNYTVMSNYHLRDKNLSLKAKRLLSQMLSLPEDWDYTLRGRMSASEYTIYETPHASSSESDKSVSPKPIRKKSTSGNPTEINKEISSKEKQNKELVSEPPPWREPRGRQPYR